MLIGYAKKGISGLRCGSVSKDILCNYSAQKRKLRLFYRFNKNHLNITFKFFKSIKREKKDMPCNTTNIYIGL